MAYHEARRALHDRSCALERRDSSQDGCTCGIEPPDSVQKALDALALEEQIDEVGAKLALADPSLEDTIDILGTELALLEQKQREVIGSAPHGPRCHIGQLLGECSCWKMIYAAAYAPAPGEEKHGGNRGR